ncbi:MAG: CHAT domain-containing protein, partial [Candidatus Eiseniibacteriota bacterium]
EALSVARAGAPDHVPWLLGRLAEAARARGDRGTALRLVLEAIDALESRRLGLADARERLTVGEEGQMIYRQAVELLLENAGGEEGDATRRSFEIFERAKARSLAESLAALDPALMQPDAAAGRRLQRLESEADSLRAEERAGYASAARLRDIRERIAVLELEADHLAGEARQRGADSRDSPLARVRTVEEVQALLDDGTVLVAFAVTPRRVHAFVVTRHGLRALLLAPTPVELAASVLNLGIALSARSAGWEEESRRLGESLADPIREAAGAGVRRWIVVPDGVLSPFPLDVLLTSSGAARCFLVEEIAVSYVSSASVLAELSERSATPHARVLALAASEPERHPTGPLREVYEDQGLELRELPATRSEAVELVRRAGRGRGVVVATEGQLGAQPLDRFGVLHFAAHALSSHEAPERSALVLATEPGGKGDGFLQSREIARLPLQAELVVLASCQSARGRPLLGEGELSLARAFFVAGARSVVATWGDVEDRSTARLMSAFYRRLSAGDSKVDALRGAKLELLAAEGRGSPWVWAPYVLLGEPLGRVPLAPPSAGRTWRLILGAGAVVALVVILFRGSRGRL